MARTSPSDRRAIVATRRRRPVLGAEAIVDVALRLVDTEGVDAVTMRRVAAEFDTGPASLYAYFPHKEALLAAVLTRVLEEIPVPTGNGWQDLLRRHMHTTRDVFARHRDVARLSFGTVPTGEHFVDIAEALLAGLLAGGVPAQVAAWAMDVGALYVAADAFEGYLQGQMFDDGSGRPPEEVGMEFYAGFADAMRALPPSRYPAITGHVDELVSGDGDDRFGFGVDMFIAGIAAQIPR